MAAILGPLRQLTPSFDLLRVPLRSWFGHGEISRGATGGRGHDTSGHRAETLCDPAFVHEYRTFGISDLIDDKSEFELRKRCARSIASASVFSAARFHRFSPGPAMHVPPDCPIQIRSPLWLAAS